MKIPSNSATYFSQREERNIKPIQNEELNDMTGLGGHGRGLMV